MAENLRGTTVGASRRRFDGRELSRLATWGLAALGALTLATYAASSNVGEDRLVLAVATIRGVPPPERLSHSPADARARELAARVHDLSADREQLLARLDTLERNMGDVTSSIARVTNPPPPATPAPAPSPPPILTAPEVAPTDGPTTAPPDIPMPRAAPASPSEEPTAARTEFGIDLGRANSVEGLRQLWTTMKNRHSAALDGLRPIVTVREVARPGATVELRLVAGPVPNAAAAARLCARLPGAQCHPTVFDGQRLALR